MTRRSSGSGPRSAKKEDLPPSPSAKPSSVQMSVILMLHSLIRKMFGKIEKDGVVIKKKKRNRELVLWNSS